MLSESATRMVDVAEAYQENLDHRLEPNAPLAEAIPNTPDESISAPPLTVDTERFTAISEHGGSLKEALQRFKDNPNTPLPRCVRNLGITSVNQLIQRAEGTDDPSKRAPTIKELREAKKREAEKQTAPADPAKKPKIVKDTLNAPASKTEYEMEKPADQTVAPTKIVMPTLERTEALEESLTPVEPPSIEPDRSIALTKKDRAHMLDIETEIILHQQALATSNQRIAETEKFVSQALPVAENVTGIFERQTPAAEGVAITHDSTLPEKHIELSSETIPDELVAEAISYVPDRPLTNENGIEPTIELEDVSTEATTFNADEIMTELEFGSFRPEIDDTAEEFAPAFTTEADHRGVEVLEPGTEILLDEVSLIFAPDTTVNLREPVVTQPETTLAEAKETFDVRMKLHEYIQSLEPDKTAAATTALTSLIEALQIDPVEAKPDVKQLAVKMKEIEQLSATLLEALDLDNKDEAVKRIMQELFTSEQLMKTTKDYKLSIDQLNHLGTHEYKPATVASLLTGLVRMIKQHAEPYLRLGRYALSASITET